MFMKLLDFNLKLKDLKEVLMFDQPQLHGYLYAKLQGRYGKKNTFVKNGSYIYAKGDIPIILLAHMDTVHAKTVTEETFFFDSERMAMWSTDGIGADCRAGVFNILDILEKGYKPHILFTWDEEIGGVGASEFVNDFSYRFPHQAKQLAEDVNFAVQFDRHGFDEAVYYDLDSPEFESYISSFGYKTEMGSYTDICELCPAYGFAGVNVAAGYTDEHQVKEILWVNEMHKSNVRVIEMIEDQIKNPTKFEYIEGANSKWYGYGNYGYGYDDYDYHGYAGTKSYGKGKSTKKKDGTIAETCSKCFIAKDLVLWDEVENEQLNSMCNECREAFLKQLELSSKHLNKDIIRCENCDKIITENDQLFLINDDDYYCSRKCFENRADANAF